MQTNNLENIFEAHFNVIEKLLIAQSNIVNHAGHNNLKGGPREWFIKDFLENHIPSNIEIGQGEIIGEFSSSKPSLGERPQIDIILYDKNLPKLSYDPNNTAYLIEGSMATIECKSSLEKKDLEQACKTGKYIKKLIETTPIHHMGVLNTVIAYKGLGLDTIIKHLKNSDGDISREDIDLIVVLGQGIIWKESIFSYFSVDESKEIEREKFESKWAYIKQDEKNLFYLFTFFLSWFSTSKNYPNLRHYNKDFEFIEYTSF